VSAGPPAFVHDLATCVGCHACVVACASENGTGPGAFWRQVVTFNEERHPRLPVFHLSLACNHCLDAPCERHCPALAIARDDRTGAVLIDAGRCIGCRYCSWVCPYDAPRFEASRGVMGKCTLCHSRLLDGGQPACTSACPTGALKLGPADHDGPRGVAGFPDVGIRPAIRFLPLRGRGPDSAAEEAAAGAGVGVGEPWPAPPRKISVRSEWTLFAFTSLVVVLVAWLAASLFGGPRVAVVPFLAAGIAGLALSSLHLGRKERAWRAALNWRRSWLSREVLAVPLFLCLAGAPLLLGPTRRLTGALAVAAGGAALLCIDRVYVVMAREKRSRGDDAAALASAAYLAGILAAQPWLALPAGLARLAAFMGRLTFRRAPAGPGAWALAAFRVGIGLALPLTLVLTSGRAALPLTVAAAIAGELVDRAHFYASLDVVTPRGRMAGDLLARLAGPAALGRHGRSADPSGPRRGPPG
jgi:Fe-S-cluster-containing dehydrogenase component